MMENVTGQATADNYDVFPPHVDISSITIPPESPSGKKAPLKTFNEISVALQAGRKQEVKKMLRENSWPINNTIRSHLWPMLCQQHAQDKQMQEGFYWDLVTQLFGTTGKRFRRYYSFIRPCFYFNRNAPIKNTLRSC